MIVTLYCRTPMAGAVYQQWQCLSKYTDHDVRMVTEKERYPDGRVFPTDLLYQKDNKEIIERIRTSDVVHIHNYLSEYLQPIIDKGKTKVIATFHSVPRMNYWKQLSDYAHKSFVIRQPFQMREYLNFNTLPNLFDIYSVNHSINMSGKIVIGYAPSNRMSNSHPGTKGFNSRSIFTHFFFSFF